MKKLLFALLLIPSLAFAAPVDNPNTSKNKAQSLSESFVDVPFASLGSLPAQYNGTVVYCPDCGTAVVCSGGGGPALALAINGTWNCQALSNTNAGGGGGSVSPLTATLDAAAHWIINIGKLTGNGIIQYANNAANALLGFSINGTYNPVAYGADPTGATDSVVATQAASDAACANSPSFFGGKTGASVVWPEGSFKMTSSPLLVSCDATIAFRGAGQNATHLDSASGAPNMGPGIVEVPVGTPAYMNPITAASLVTGTGSDFSMNWGTTGTQNNYSFLLNTVWEASGSAVNNPLSGLSAETIDFFIKPLQHGSDANGTIYGLFHMDNSLTDIHPSVKLLGTWIYGSGGTSVIKVCQSTTGNPSPSNSTQPPPKCIQASVPNSVVSYVQFNYDGSLHLATGLPGGTAIFVASVASSGTIQNNQNDDFWLGEASTDPSQFMSGQLDSFRISKSVRNADGGLSTFTAPSAKFATDSNTIFLANTQSVKNINVNGVTPYVFALKTATGAGWLVPFGVAPPSGGGIQSIDDMTITSGFTLNESLSNGLAVNRTVFNSGYFAGYYGWAQAYNTRFESVGFTNFNTIYQLREDGNTFGSFNNLSFSSGYYLIMGSGGGTFTNIFEQIGSGTIVANTFLGKGDLFTADFVDYLVTDAEEGGSAIPIAVGGALSKFTIDHSVFQPAGGGSPALQIGGQPPNHMWIGNSGIFGNIQFDTFINSSRPGLQSEPITLENDYTSTGAGTIGLLNSSVCTPYPFACQIIGGNTQFSRLGIQVGPPQPIGYAENNIGTNTVTVSKVANAQSGDAYVMVINALGANPSTFTIPSDWTQAPAACSSSDTALGNPSTAYSSTFWHIASVSDPANWTFTWSNSPVGKYLVTVVRGADQSNPIDTCFGSHNNSVTAVPLTGGTSTNINDLILDYIGYYTGTGVTLAVGATPPSDLAVVRNGGSFGNQAWWYTPASLTIPTVNYVLSSSSQPWAGLQIAVRSKTQSATVLGNTVSAHVMFQGMAGASFQSASGPFVNTCKGDVALSTGAGTFTNACVTTASACDSRDITTPANLCVVAAPGSGSVGLTGTGTDVCRTVCQ